MFWDFWSGTTTNVLRVFSRPPPIRAIYTQAHISQASSGERSDHDVKVDIHTERKQTLKNWALFLVYCKNQEGQKYIYLIKDTSNLNLLGPITVKSEITYCSQHWCGDCCKNSLKVALQLCDTASVWAATGNTSDIVKNCHPKTFYISQLIKWHIWVWYQEWRSVMWPWPVFTQMQSLSITDLWVRNLL